MSYEVVENGLLLYRSTETDDKANYGDCVVWLAKYNRAKPGNKARIQVSAVQQLGMFS
jgi:hypothetical protein